MSTAPLRTYSPDQISVIIGDRPLTGFMDGDSITVARLEDSFTEVSGLKGEVARAKSSDKRTDITLTLMQTSPDNDYLSGILQEDEISGRATFNIMIRDQNGTSLHEAEKAWIVKAPDTSYAKELTGREWTLRAANMSMFVGGTIDA